MAVSAPDFVGVFGWLEEAGEVVVVATYRDLGAAGRQLCWELPGGKVEKGESAESAMRREMREETGLEVEVLNCIFTFRGERVSRGRRRYGWEGRFFSLRRAGGVLKPGDAETVDARLVPIEQLNALLTAPYHRPVLNWLASGRTMREDYLLWDDAS